MKVRKSIYLDDKLAQALKETSILMGRKETVIIREGLWDYIRKIQEKRKKENPLYDLIGMCDKGKKDASQKHDFYLYQKDKE